MSREIDWKDLMAGWDKHGTFYIQHRHTTRFVGIGGALARKNLDAWRTWPTEPRKLTLCPSSKFPELDDNMLPANKPAIRHYPPDWVCDLSETYQPKGSGDVLPLAMIDELDDPSPLLL
jgi:hypothetical protein